MSRRDCEFREPTLRREQVVRRENIRGEFQSEPEESQPTESRDDAEARADFWSISGDFISCNEPRVQLHVPNIPMPLKDIDVTRCTHTNLNVMHEKRIDDHWNVDAKRSFSDSWKGLTKFVLLKEKASKRYMWSEGD